MPADSAARSSGEGPSRGRARPERLADGSAPSVGGTAASMPGLATLADRRPDSARSMRARFDRIGRQRRRWEQEAERRQPTWTASILETRPGSLPAARSRRSTSLPARMPAGNVRRRGRGGPRGRPRQQSAASRGAADGAIRHGAIGGSAGRTTSAPRIFRSIGGSRAPLRAAVPVSLTSAGGSPSLPNDASASSTVTRRDRLLPAAPRESRCRSASDGKRVSLTVRICN